MPSKSEDLRPRLCLLQKGDNGYGFHLHGEKGKTGQFIRLVEPDSPSESSGLRAGDRLVYVNGENVESENHQQVVQRIRATAAENLLELIVVDLDTEHLLKKHNMKCLKEYVTIGIPLPYDESEPEDEINENGTPIESTPIGTPIESTPNGTPTACTPNGTPTASTPHGTPIASTPNGTPRESTPVPDPENNGEMIHSHIEKKSSLDSEKEAMSELRPRLCVIQRGSNGYGFNLHSEKARPGQYVRAVDLDSPAQHAGLLPGDRIVQVNGLAVENLQHSEVVAAIKAGGSQTSLLVVDPETDDFFKRCRTAATAEHITGSLPVPVINGDMEEKVNGRSSEETGLRDSKLSVSPSPSNTSSNNSLATPTTGTPPPEISESMLVESVPGLNLSLQQVKERAHQKRSNKRAPPMDWSKKNELFSNL